ncbi:MAG TPA: hypothetical protein VLL54_09255 [Pyrinomonadaceae bacterium]|nr:hypothetical protein [Pyrinomonadaceae bacterium]
MRTIKKYASTLPIVALCMLVLGSAVAVSQKKFMMLRAGRPVVKVVLAGVVERDDTKVPVEKAEMVKSGEVMDWTITSVNEGNAPAEEYKAVGKIPAGTQFVAGTAKADGAVAVTYSIDNGKSFSAAPTVDERQADGSVKKVAAPVSMYNQIRYEWSTPLTEGAKLNASYKVRLN